MSEKQIQQHRQHFNLSEEAKQKLEELTARRYPGKQRRQSQLVEDLIGEAFAKELGMNIRNSGAHEPPDRLAPASYQTLDQAQDRARELHAREVYPEHLLLVLLEQGYDRTLKALHRLRVDNIVKIQNQIIAVSVWHDVEERYMRDEVLMAKITGCNKEGLIATVSGIRGFVPVSQLLNFTGEEVAPNDDNPEAKAKLQHLIGKELQLKIIEVNRERQRLILSEHLTLKGERQRRHSLDPWATLNERYRAGQTVIGIITKIAPFGAFASIEDGVEGLIHQSEFAPDVGPHTSFHEGQRVRLRITRIDAGRHRLGLSLHLASEPATGVTEDSPLEERSATTIGAPSTNAGEPDVNIAFSWDLLQCIDSAAATARRMRSELVQPQHLLVGVLQNERIQSSLAPWLPSPEVLDSPTVGGFSRDEQSRPGSCPSCRRSVQAHWKHCVYCGKLLALTCPKCGTPRAEAEGVRFCFECGSPLE